MMERHDMILEWLTKAIHKIPRDESIVALEHVDLVELEENIDETTKAD